MKMRTRQTKLGFITLKRPIVYTLLGTWSVICLLPIYWMTITSFKDVSSIDKPPTYVPLLDFMPSLDAWRFILFDANENLVSRAFNSIVIGIVSTLLTLVIGGMLVYGLTRFSSKFGSSGIMAAILSTRILPPVVLALPLYFMAQKTGTLDTLGVLVFIYTAINLPLVIWMLTPVFGPRATDQEEAAMLDGATHFYIFFFILVPMLKAAIITVGLLVFLQCWNEYLFAAFLTSDHALTLPPWLVGQLSMKEAQTGGGAEEVAHLAAATVLMALPVVLLTIFAQRSLTRVFLRSAANRND
jgi:multiple sugar transport system permease protein